MYYIKYENNNNNNNNNDNNSSNNNIVVLREKYINKHGEFTTDGHQQVKVNSYHLKNKGKSIYSQKHP